MSLAYIKEGLVRFAHNDLNVTAFVPSCYQIGVRWLKQRMSRRR